MYREGLRSEAVTFGHIRLPIEIYIAYLNLYLILETPDLQPLLVSISYSLGLLWCKGVVPNL